MGGCACVSYPREEDGQLYPHGGFSCVERWIPRGISHEYDLAALAEDMAEGGGLFVFNVCVFMCVHASVPAMVELVHAQVVSETYCTKASREGRPTLYRIGVRVFDSSWTERDDVVLLNVLFYTPGYWRPKLYFSTSTEEWDDHGDQLPHVLLDYVMAQRPDVCGRPECRGSAVDYQVTVYSRKEDERGMQRRVDDDALAAVQTDGRRGQLSRRYASWIARCRVRRERLNTAHPLDWARVCQSLL